MHRRAVLKSAAALALSTAAEPLMRAADTEVPVVDCHIHLFDPSRPGGVPWPEKTDKVLYQAALPARYEQLARPHHVVGAIAVECSPWMVDNFWLQDVVEQNPIMLGFIGDLLPESPDFGAALDFLHRSPMFLGIRYGNLWNRDLGAAAHNPEFLSGLKLLAQAGLVLETANPDATLIAAVVEVSDRVPDLRIVLDHLPHAEAPTDESARATYEANLMELSRRPKIFVKGSEIVKRVDGRVSLDVESYKAGLDRLWDLFGEGRMFFGSDWPNSDTLASYDDTFGVAQRYIATRSEAARQKYFFKNSISVYKWQARTPEQAQLLKL
jgi:predicted TIM-barrel fold metal-dependent hydrolase